MKKVIPSFILLLLLSACNPPVENDIIRCVSSRPDLDHKELGFLLGGFNASLPQEIYVSYNRENSKSGFDQYVANSGIDKSYFIKNHFSIVVDIKIPESDDPIQALGTDYDESKHLLNNMNAGFVYEGSDGKTGLRALSQSFSDLVDFQCRAAYGLVS